jgi:hypothetical protein
MNIELSRRDVELLLLIMDDVEDAAFECEGKSPYAMEELMLYDKLEKALIMMETHNVSHFTTNSQLSH